MKKILAISGSTRKSSANLSLIRAISALYDSRLQVVLYDGLAGLPHFNPDLDTDVPPASVAAFRKQLREADGVLICTPEYAMGVPGTLKNALDWTVSAMDFSHKPVALITASSSGQKAHQSLLETLRVIEAHLTTDTQLLISHVKTKVGEHTISDAHTLAAVHNVMDALICNMDNPPVNPAYA